MSLVSESGTWYGFRNPMCGNPKIGLCKINTCSTKKGKLMAPRKEKLMGIYIVNMNIAFLFIISDTYISFRPCRIQFCHMWNSCEKSLLMCSLIHVEFKQWIYQYVRHYCWNLKTLKNYSFSINLKHDFPQQHKIPCELSNNLLIYKTHMAIAWPCWVKTVSMTN